MGRVPILVQKFGGTSVSTPERRRQAVAHVARARAEGQQVAIVVSAMGRKGEPYATDTLLDLLRSDGGPVDPADYDLIFACGEAISVAVMSQALKRAGIPAIGLTAAQARIFTDGHHVEADVREIDTSRLHSLMAADLVPVVTGGQGVAPGTLDFTTLGRGGSDTSGVALGAALHAHRVDIFTDVEGVAVADPRLVPGAPMMRRVSYAAMFELARFGARVVHPRALRTGWDTRTPIAVRSTFGDDPGTLVADVDDERPLVGIAHLAAMRTLVLSADCVDAPRLDEWERRRLILALADARTGHLVVGAPADKETELDRAIDEAGLTPLRRESACWWVSVVGHAGTVREQVPGWVARLEREEIELVAHGVNGNRATFVVPEGAGASAARALYDDAFSRYLAMPSQQCSKGTARA
jgi:aspartate kinase